MNPAKVQRAKVRILTDLPNVGPSVAGDLRSLGIRAPEQLLGQDPVALYDRLCALTGVRQDPCVLDVFISVVRFMGGEEPKPWWAYTDERKRMARR
ncbi:MAG TPA: helix-hairpin-helix domain-containing protein [Holophagaceae bacterium]|nr:helix-hairpin-helix domain-containing protein [Holophagaceae bacterium]